MTVVGWVSGGGGNAVRIMADGTGRVLALDMLLMPFEALVAQDGAPVVARIAQGIRLRGFLGVVGGRIV